MFTCRLVTSYISLRLIFSYKTWECCFQVIYILQIVRSFTNEFIRENDVLCVNMFEQVRFLGFVVFEYILFSWVLIDRPSKLSKLSGFWYIFHLCEAFRVLPFSEMEVSNMMAKIWYVLYLQSSSSHYLSNSYVCSWTL